MFKILQVSQPKKDKIDKAIVESYLSGEMPLKEIKEFSKLFTDRISYILHYIEKKFDDRLLLTIFDYGETIPEKYSKNTKEFFRMSQALYYEDIKEYIPLKVEIIPGFPYVSYQNPFYEKIPTRWLYEDFYDEVEVVYQQNVKDAKEFGNKNKTRKEIISKLPKSIQSKLTEDELKVISLKLDLEVPFKDLNI